MKRWWPLAVLVLYAIAHVIVGALDTRSLVLAIVLMVMRFVAIVIVPFIAVYRLVMRILRRWTDGGVRSSADDQVGGARDVSRRM